MAGYLNYDENNEKSNEELGVNYQSGDKGPEYVV